jgi:hypothetical protein
LWYPVNGFLLQLTSLTVLHAGWEYADGLRLQMINAIKIPAPGSRWWDSTSSALVSERVDLWDQKTREQPLYFISVFLWSVGMHNISLSMSFIIRILHCTVTCISDFWRGSDLMIGFVTLIHSIQRYCWSTDFKSSPLHTNYGSQSSLVVSLQRLLTLIIAVSL